MSALPGDVLAFWFSAAARQRWFKATPEFDREIGERFEPLVRAALAGELAAWQSSAEGALALVILLDQFPRNIYRGTAHSFAGAEASRRVAETALAAGFEQVLNDSQKAFLYLPFMHSESLADQERSVRLFTEAGLQENLEYARHHRDLVRRFGRFPHRNAILGRTSTPAEEEYLASPDAFHG